MKLFDYHTHNEISFDSEATLLGHCEWAVKKGLAEIALTNHHELDMVLFFNDPNDPDPRRAEEVSYISSLCDKHNVPFASNVATAEMLVLGLDRGDLDWREVLYPRNLPFTS